MTWRFSPRTLLCLSAAFLLLLAVPLEARDAGLNLPPCDKARDLYKAGKLYDVLGLKKTAKKKDIRKAFKNMSVKCHPDKDRGNDKADENFIAITGAYETLSDEDQRREYDTYGPESQTSGGGGRTSGGGRGAGGFGGGQGAGSGGFHFNFGGGSGGNFQRSSGRSRGAGGQRWKPKDFGDINVDDILRSFFGGEAGGGAGTGAGTGGSGFRFTSSGGGAGAGAGAGDDDSLFDSLFKDFSFGSRKRAGGRGKTSGGSGSHIRTRTEPPSGPTGGGLFGMRDGIGHGGMFDDLFGSLKGMDDLTKDVPGGAGRQGGATQKKAPSKAPSSKTKSSSSSKKPSSSKTASGKPASKSKPQVKKDAERQTKSQKLRAEQERRAAEEKARRERKAAEDAAQKRRQAQEARRKARQSTDGRNCRFSMRDGEICD